MQVDFDINSWEDTMNKVKYSLKVAQDVDICIIKRIAYSFDTTPHFEKVYKKIKWTRLDQDVSSYEVFYGKKKTIKRQDIFYLNVEISCEFDLKKFSKEEIDDERVAFQK